MAMTHDKPAADIIDLNATRAETEAANDPETEENQAVEASIEEAAETASEPSSAETDPVAANLPVGQILANARKAAELSLADIVAATKIKQAHLEAIEASDNASLPAIPFTAGFIKVYANHLELDSNALVKQFKDEVAAGTVTATPDAPAAPSSEMTAPLAAPSPSYQGGDTTRWASIVGIAAIALFALWIMMQVFKPGGGTDAPTPPRVVEAQPEPNVTMAAAEAPAVLNEAPASEEMTTEDVFAQETTEPVLTEPAVAETPAADEPAVEDQPETAVADAAEEVVAPEETTEDTASAEAELAEADVADEETAPAETETVVETTEALPGETEAVETDGLTDVEIAMAAQTEALAAAAEDTPAAEPVETTTEPELADAFNIASVEGAPAILVDAPVEEPSLPETEFVATGTVDETLIETAALETVENDAVEEAAPVNTADLNAAQAELIATPPAREVTPPPPVRQQAPAPKIVNAQIRKQVAPAYPSRCQLRAADNETVVVRMDVLIDGRPANVGVQSSTNGCFDRAATTAARRLRFEPRTVNGTQQVEVGKTVTFNFPK